MTLSLVSSYVVGWGRLAGFGGGLHAPPPVCLYWWEQDVKLDLSEEEEGDDVVAG